MLFFAIFFKIDCSIELISTNCLTIVLICVVETNLSTNFFASTLIKSINLIFLTTIAARNIFVVESLTTCREEIKSCLLKNARFAKLSCQLLNKSNSQKREDKDKLSIKKIDKIEQSLSKIKTRVLCNKVELILYLNKDIKLIFLKIL